jgi:hypothetical protein
MYRDDTIFIERAYRLLTMEERRTLADAVSIARSKGLPLETLAWYCFGAIGDGALNFLERPEKPIFRSIRKEKSNA